jgi:hypothetical protein
MPFFCGKGQGFKGKEQRRRSGDQAVEQEVLEKVTFGGVTAESGAF